MSDEQEYGLSLVKDYQQIEAPDLPYLPPKPKAYNPAIGLIGCGGITEYHLKAYREQGFRIAALCDIDFSRAEDRRNEFYPGAKVFEDYRKILEDPEIEVVDIATHPEERVEIIEDSLEAGKHVLSQKPFVVDIEEGRRLVQIAKAAGRFLAVNQNGRWAPHFAYLNQVVRSGILGDIVSVDLSLQWDHDWVADTVFNEVRHLLLYDFAIHWFDITCCFLPGKDPQRVMASVRKSPTQKSKQPLVGHVFMDFDQAQANLSLNGSTRLGQRDRTVIVGSKGTARSTGPSLSDQMVTVHTEAGWFQPRLEGTWFKNGFEGTMGELLCAIEEGRTPSHNAEENLNSIALCFAAVASSVEGWPKTVGEVLRVVD